MEKQKPIITIFRYGYLAMALSVCAGTAVIFPLYWLIDGFDFGIYSIFSFFSCFFAGELRSLLASAGSVGFFDVFLITVICVVIAGKTVLLSFINIRALRQRDREPSYFNLALFGVDTLGYLVAAVNARGIAGLFPIFILCIVYRVILIAAQCISAHLDAKYR